MKKGGGRDMEVSLSQGQPRLSVRRELGDYTLRVNFEEGCLLGGFLIEAGLESAFQDG